jgi:hypothetical protein
MYCKILEAFLKKKQIKKLKMSIKSFPKKEEKKEKR